VKKYELLASITRSIDQPSNGIGWMAHGPVPVSNSQFTRCKVENPPQDASKRVECVPVRAFGQVVSLRAQGSWCAESTHSTPDSGFAREYVTGHHRVGNRRAGKLELGKLAAL
jgi:hypothetical protein